MSTYTGKKSTQQLGVHVVYGLDRFDFRLCGMCGVAWAMPEAFINARRQDGADFYCPNGHQWQYTGESREKKLERELGLAKDDLARTRARSQQAEASLRATRGVVTKQKRKLARVTNGVCPCCNRSFQNLHRHMQTKHPEYHA